MKVPAGFCAALTIAIATACGGATRDTGDGGASGGSASGVCAGSATTDGCNRCTCSHGEWLCTANACPPGNGGAGSAGAGGAGPRNTWDAGVSGAGGAGAGAGAVSGLGGSGTGGGTSEVCEPHAKRGAGDGCNTCECGWFNNWICSQNDCTTCPPWQESDDGCNHCKCVNDRWTCSDVSCPPPGCTTGETKMLNCHTCTCNVIWSCTQETCPPPEDAGARKPCGGRLGDTCSASEYCAYDEGQLCGAADATATCAPRPTSCVDVQFNVCGCDGTSYWNECYAAMHGTGVLRTKNCN